MNMVHVLYFIPFFITLAWTIYLARARKLRSMAHLMFMIFAICCTIMFLTHSGSFYQGTFRYRRLLDIIDAFNALAILPSLYLFLRETKKTYTQPANHERVNFASYLRCIGWKGALFFLPSLVIGLTNLGIYAWIAITDSSIQNTVLEAGESIYSVIDSPYQPIYTLMELIWQVAMLLQLFEVIIYIVSVYLSIHVPNLKEKRNSILVYIMPIGRKPETSGIYYKPQAIDKFAWVMITALVIMSVTLFFNDNPMIETIKLSLLQAIVWIICFIMSRYGVLVLNPNARGINLRKEASCDDAPSELDEWE